MRTIAALALLLTACTAPNPAPQGALEGTPEDTTAGLRAAMLDAIGRLAALEAASADLAGKVSGLLAAGPGASQLALDNLGKDVAALGERIGKLEAKQGGGGAKQPHLVAMDGTDLGVYVDRCTGAVDLNGGKVAITQWCASTQVVYDAGMCAGGAYVRLTDRAFTTGNLSARYISPEGQYLAVRGRVTAVSVVSAMANGKCVTFSPERADVIPVAATAGGARTYAPDELHVEMR